jgi:hypothetical protein
MAVLELSMPIAMMRMRYVRALVSLAISASQGPGRRPR